MHHVLLVEDDDDLARTTSSALARLARVQRVHSDAEAREALRVIVPDLVIADVHGCTAASPLEMASSLRIALDRAAASVGARPVPLVLASGADPSVLVGIAGALAHTYARPKPYSIAALRELVAQLTGGS